MADPHILPHPPDPPPPPGDASSTPNPLAIFTHFINQNPNAISVINQFLGLISCFPGVTHDYTNHLNHFPVFSAPISAPNHQPHLAAAPSSPELAGGALTAASCQPSMPQQSSPPLASSFPLPIAVRSSSELLHQAAFVPSADTAPSHSPSSGPDCIGLDPAPIPAGPPTNLALGPTTAAQFDSQIICNGPGASPSLNSPLFDLNGPADLGSNGPAIYLIWAQIPSTHYPPS